MMRSLMLVTTLAVFMGAPAWAEEIEVGSAVVGATLYPQGASVERQAAFDVEAGRHTVLVTGLTAQYQQQSLRVTGEGAFRILSIVERQAASRALEAQRRSASRDLQQAILSLRDKRTFAQNAVEAANTQLEFINRMSEAQAVASAVEDAPAAVPGEHWTAMWSSVGVGVKNALDRRNRAQIELREIDEQLQELTAQLRDVGIERSFGPVLAIEIEADGAVEGILVVKYQTQLAAWRPVYDARLDLGDDPAMTLVRRAEVQQRTGEDWRDISLTLSTAKPSGRTAAPDPRLLFARIREEQPELEVMADSFASRGMAMEAPMPAPAPVYSKSRPATAPQAVQVMAVATVAGETVQFAVSGASSVSGSGERKQVLIDEIDVTPDLEVRATPSLDKTGYLYASAENTGTGPILPGTASLYRDGVYVGRTQIARIAAGDTAHLPFGSYDSVKIMYREIERIEGEAGLIRARQTERRRYEMSAENLGAKPIAVVLRDSMPYAEDEDVEITLRADPKPDERDVDGRKGTLAWRFTLEPGEKSPLRHGYDISYPMGVELLLAR